MPNEVYRNRLINDIQYAVNEARGAAGVHHPGLIGRIRELAAEKLLRPILPASFSVGTGKIVDRNGALSAEVDLVVYNRNLLPALMYSDRDGLYPIESAYYAFEVKSQCSAAAVRDAIEKTRQIIALDHSSKSRYQGNKSPAGSVLLAFGSDLTGEARTELARYQEIDPAWRDDPVVKVICIVGRGYWYFSPQRGWMYQRATQSFAEVLILLAQVVNTLANDPIVSDRPAPRFGDYLRPQNLATDQ